MNHIQLTPNQARRQIRWPVQDKRVEEAVKRKIHLQLHFINTFLNWSSSLRYTMNFDDNIKLLKDAANNQGGLVKCEINSLFFSHPPQQVSQLRLSPSTFSSSSLHGFARIVSTLLEHTLNLCNNCTNLHWQFTCTSLLLFFNTLSKLLHGYGQLYRTPRRSRVRLVNIFYFFSISTSKASETMVVCFSPIYARSSSLSGKFFGASKEIENRRRCCCGLPHRKSFGWKNRQLIISSFLCTGKELQWIVCQSAWLL